MLEPGRLRRDDVEFVSKMDTLYPKWIRGVLTEIKLPPGRERLGAKAVWSLPVSSRHCAPARVAVGGREVKVKP